MASYTISKTLAILALTLAFCVQGIIGEGIECENLNKDSCAFAVSSSGKRCVLEKHVRRSGEEKYVCRASEIKADKLKDLVESDQCVEACGLDRTQLGISSDSLLESEFTNKLCSTQCYGNCPNIVDLYFNLAAGEGEGIECENLNKDSCAFAVSSSGKRCVLEKHVRRSGEEKYVCRASEIKADKLKDLVESDQCVEACGLDRTQLGISSDSLLESEFTHKLCSTQCYGNCPNIVDLYFNLAAGEGVFLPKLCEVQGGETRRGMAEIRSSGYVAPGPKSGGAELRGSGYYAPAPELGTVLVGESYVTASAPAPY